MPTTMKMVALMLLLSINVGSVVSASPGTGPVPGAYVAHVSSGNGMQFQSSDSEAHKALEAGQPRRALELLASRTLEMPLAERRSVEARALLMTGKPIQARKALKAALRDRPNHGPDLYWLGRAYQAVGSAAIAGEQYAHADHAGFDSADLHFHWAEVLHSSGVVLGHATQTLLPEDAEGEDDGDGLDEVLPGQFAFGGLVVGLVPGRQDYAIICPRESALYQVHRVLTIEPNRGEALLLSAQLWASINRHEKATLQYKAAASQLGGADLAVCHAGWAESLLAEADFSGYIRHSRESMVVTGCVKSAKLARCYARAAREVAKRGDLKRQIAYLTLAVELRPNVDDYLLLVDALLQARRPDDAESYLLKARALKPSKRQRTTIDEYQLRSSYPAPKTSLRNRPMGG